MGSRVSPVLLPSNFPPSKAGSQAAGSHLKSLISAAGQNWSTLTEPVSSDAGEIATAFAQRVEQLAPSLPEELEGMSVKAGTESVVYRFIPEPPYYECVHTLETSVTLQGGSDSFQLAFQIPCTECLN